MRISGWRSDVFSSDLWSLAEAKAGAPLRGRCRLVDGAVGHVFTHFALELTIATAEVAGNGAGEGVWCPPARLSDYALPTVMKKVAKHAMAVDQAARLD